MSKKSYLEILLKFNLKKGIKQDVQGLQTFTFSVVTVNDEHKKPRFRRTPRDNFEEGIGTELCLRLWLLSQDGFESGCRGSKS